MYIVGLTMGYCLIPLIFYLVALSRSGKGKNPWTFYAIGAVITVLAVFGGVVGGDFGVPQIVSLILAAVFAGVIYTKNS